MISTIEQLRNSTNYGTCKLHQRIKDYVNTDQYNFIVPTHNMRFTPYQSDEVQDNGWGCAWRSIQMVLSSQYNQTPSFAWLFSFFGQQDILYQIYVQKNKLHEVPLYLKQADFAPQNLKNGWAEPFIGQMIMHYMGFNTELFLINNYPPNANAPFEVFQKVLTFKQFRDYLKEHFQITTSPLQIDDATYSMVINNAEFEGDFTTLFIGDPHIISNKNENIRKIGIYKILLDIEGNQVERSITKDEEQYYMYENSYKTLHFNGKSWMVMTITGVIDKWNDWQNRIVNEF